MFILHKNYAIGCFSNQTDALTLLRNTAMLVPVIRLKVTVVKIPHSVMNHNPPIAIRRRTQPSMTNQHQGNMFCTNKHGKMTN